jgi:hypothetical protein
MIVVRDVFQAKYGRGGELVQLMKELEEKFGIGQRIYTDMSGPFFTVVTETEVESMDAWESMLQEAFSDSSWQDWFSKMVPLVETGRREFYRLEAKR